MIENCNFPFSYIKSEYISGEWKICKKVKQK